MRRLLYIFVVMTAVCACGGRKGAVSQGADDARRPVGPVFSADSAYAFCEAQCAFGPRTMNSEAHEQCGEWIASKFRSYGLEA